MTDDTTPTRENREDSVGVGTWSRHQRDGRHSDHNGPFPIKSSWRNRLSCFMEFSKESREKGTRI